jgi:hypothetical protein
LLESERTLHLHFLTIIDAMTRDDNNWENTRRLLEAAPREPPINWIDERQGEPARRTIWRRRMWMVLDCIGYAAACLVPTAVDAAIVYFAYTRIK